MGQQVQAPMPTYFGNCCLRFLPVFDLLICRLIECYAKMEKHVEPLLRALLEEYGVLFRYHRKWRGRWIRGLRRSKGSSFDIIVSGEQRRGRGRRRGGKIRKLRKNKESCFNAIVKRGQGRGGAMWSSLLSFYHVTFIPVSSL